MTWSKNTARVTTRETTIIMNDRPEESPAQQPEDDGLRLTEIEARYLAEDNYDESGHLSKDQPGDVLRELIHEIRNTRAAIRIAQATFVSRTEMETKIKTAKDEARVERKKSTRRLHWMIGIVAASVIALAGIGAFATWAIYHSRDEQNYERCLQGNDFRKGDKDLWNEVINLSHKPNPTPQEQKATAEFEAFLAKHDKLSVCKKP